MYNDCVMFDFDLKFSFNGLKSNIGFIANNESIADDDSDNIDAIFNKSI